MKKPSIPIKKKSGPNTAKGKLVSAQNAIKTGLTAKQLLNDHEFLRLSQLQADLTSHYTGTNPLIALQIEKITRLQIQLERIQNAIDVLYRQSEKQDPTKNTKKEISELNMMEHGLSFRIKLKMVDQKILQKIEYEIIEQKLGDIIFFQSKKVMDKKEESVDFDSKPEPISQQSLLGAYLYSEAEFYQQNLDDYIDEKMNAISNARNGRELLVNINLEILARAIDRRKRDDLTNQLQPRDSYERISLENWFTSELSKVPDSIKKIRKAIDPDKNSFNLALPNFDDLDRLMRYQTTISRQLSTAIGELMVLAK